MEERVDVTGFLRIISREHHSWTLCKNARRDADWTCSTMRRAVTGERRILVCRSTGFLTDRESISNVHAAERTRLGRFRQVAGNDLGTRSSTWELKWRSCERRPDLVRACRSRRSSCPTPKGASTQLAEMPANGSASWPAPGLGKSSTIEERVRWLIDTGVSPDAITAISFTRAASFDLRGRIHGYCLTRGQPDGADVRVSTLHSLALRTLRLAGALEGIPPSHLS